MIDFTNHWFQLKSKYATRQAARITIGHEVGPMLIERLWPVLTYANPGVFQIMQDKWVIENGIYVIFDKLCEKIINATDP